MTRALFRLVFASSLLGLMLAVPAAAQDFQKSYRAGAGASVRISTVSGDVKVTAYNGDVIIVMGFKEGRDLDMVDIEDRSRNGNVDVGVRYPENCRCNVSVRFEVQVPASVGYDFRGISSVSGDVEVIGVTGRLKASSVSGTVNVKEVTGTVNASSVSGDVEVEISRFEGKDDMKFSSVSGSVHVKVPSNLDAEIDMSSFSGSINTDFPVEVRKDHYTSRQWARGRVGDGSRNLHMSSVSGSLSLKSF
ncbi:MAG: DUF4097 family beta strand repeat-containing protein [Blastocatellia bacterium]|nr:DUF4097 family beta strand repeat-containing protein [Blastocatellia bacterium]